MDYLKIRHDGPICLLTLNRPEKHNAFNQGFLAELEQAFNELAQNPANRLLIITGAGQKSFSSGVDLEAVADFPSADEARRFALQLEAANEALLRFPKPVIAAINGYALGGGFGLAASADVRLLTPSAKIGFTAVRLGAVLPIGCTLRLNALIGSGRSRELLLSARLVEAQEALRIGLVSFIAKKGDLLPQAYRLAEEILQGADLALQMTKQMTNQHLLAQLQQYSAAAAENFAFLATTQEWKTRMKNFINRK